MNCPIWLLMPVKVETWRHQTHESRTEKLHHSQESLTGENGKGKSCVQIFRCGCAARESFRPA
jgi:hypothetical protein